MEKFLGGKKDTLQFVHSLVKKVKNERERHSDVFLYDLIAITNAYLRERTMGKEMVDIEQLWKLPSQRVNAAHSFFISKIFPQLSTFAQKSDVETDKHAALFLSGISDLAVVSFSLAARVNAAPR